MVGEKTLASLLIVFLNNPAAEQPPQPTEQPRVEVAAPAKPERKRRVARVPQFEYEGREASPRTEAGTPKVSRAALARERAADRKRRFAARKKTQPNAHALAMAQMEVVLSRKDR